MIVLSRAMAAEGMYPGGRSAGVELGPARSAGGRRGALRAGRAGAARRSRITGSCRTSSRCSASRNWAREDRLIVGRARRLQRFLTQPFTVTEAFTGMPGRSVPLADTLAGCRAILDGEATGGPRARSTWSARSTRRGAREQLQGRSRSSRSEAPRHEPRAASDHLDTVGHPGRRASSWRCARRTRAAASASCRAMRIS